MSRANAGGEKTDSFGSLGNTEAAITYNFTKENSLVLKAEKVVVSQLQNIDEEGMFLASKSNWRKKYKVISATYTGESCLIICARYKQTEFTIKAKADILGQIEGGRVDSGFETTLFNSCTYDSIGESGVLTIRLFKLNIFKRTQMLRNGNATAPDFKIEDTIDIAIENDFYLRNF